MSRKQKNPKFDETAWNAYAKELLTRLKSEGKVDMSKRDLRKSLECEPCANWHGLNQDFRKKLILRLILQAKKDGYSTELFEHWLNNPNPTSHGHSLTLAPQEVQEMFETAFPKG